MKITEIQENFKQLGLRKAYRPYLEPESERVMLKVRRPAQIVDGHLHGSEIDLHAAETLRIWTAKKKKARTLAQKHGLRVRLLDGEAELFVPAALADAILPVFGACTKRELSPEQLEAVRARMKKARNGLSLRKIPVKNEVPAIGTATGALPYPRKPEPPFSRAGGESK
ncbi:MAG: hypothetical protein WC687_04385 [Patescibacteria group bacterium]|jgi:hypothetical protein